MATELEKTTADTAFVIKQINDAQYAWARGVERIGAADPKDAQNKLNHLLNNHYDFDEDGNFILFKPTLASEVPLRTNRDQTASYFIGNLPDKPIPEDEDGFARTPWEKVSFEDDFFFTVLESGDVLVMGRCHFYKSAEKSSEPEATADYTFGYRKDSMRIFLHNSSHKVGEKESKNFKNSQHI